MKILLIGPRGSGKTTVGRLLAAEVGGSFVDLDDRVRGLFAEPTVQDIWAAHGEAAWRRAETEALHQVLSAAHACVIALGGGTPMIADASREIAAARRSGARVVYLRCSVATLQARLRAAEGDRPPLVGTDVVAEVATILAAREATYLALADLVYPAGDHPPAGIARGIRAALRSGASGAI